MKALSLNDELTATRAEIARLRRREAALQAAMQTVDGAVSVAQVKQNRPGWQIQRVGPLNEPIAVRP